MKRISILFIVVFLFVGNTEAQSVSTKKIKKHIAYLASDSLHGRGTGTIDENEAAAYIAKVFKQNKIGFLPGTNSYFQAFTFKENKNPHSEDTTVGTVRHGKNVVGYIDNHASQTIVIGAHYDHLGMGHDHNSLDPNPEGKIHNGADDNASGTSGVLELSRILASQKSKLPYNVIVCLFSGEELGLVGSKKFVAANKLDSSKINYMLNFDMIGRMNDTTKSLLVMGYGTALEWGQMVPSCNAIFHIKYDSAGIGPSDYASFYLENIPVLGFFTGQHSDYHKPSDDIDKINFKGEQEVLEFALRIIESSEKYPKMTFTKTANKETGRSKYKVSMGVMPDYVFDGKGLRIDGVTDGKPAAAAGLKKGDIITHFDDLEIANIQDYMKALGNTQKGDTKKVTILRGNETLVLEVKF